MIANDSNLSLKYLSKRCCVETHTVEYDPLIKGQVACTQ